MTLVIDKNNANRLSDLLKEKLSKKVNKGNLSKHFAALKRGIDGFEYQQKARENES